MTAKRWSVPLMSALLGGIAIAGAATRTRGNNGSRSEGKAGPPPTDAAVDAGWGALYSPQPGGEETFAPGATGP